MKKPIQVLIELPTWLGDAVMATPAIENIAKHFQNLQITIIGSHASTELFTNHQKVIKVIFLEKNLRSLFLISRNLKKFDIFFFF